MRSARRLTEAEMQQVEEIIKEEAWDKGIIRVFDLLLADIGSSWESEDDIAPWEFAIPEDQWQEIGKWLLAAGDREGLNLLLVWMNNGPSGFKEEEGLVV